MIFLQIHFTMDCKRLVGKNCILPTLKRWRELGDRTLVYIPKIKERLNMLRESLQT